MRATEILAILLILFYSGQNGIAQESPLPLRLPIDFYVVQLDDLGSVPYLQKDEALGLVEGVNGLWSRCGIQLTLGKMEKIKFRSRSSLSFSPAIYQERVAQLRAQTGLEENQFSDYLAYLAL